MPDLQVVFHPDAVEEAAAARLWYAGSSQSAADSFLAELDQGVESIANTPDRCLSRTLVGICSAGFRSRSSIESSAIELK